MVTDSLGSPGSDTDEDLAPFSAAELDDVRNSGITTVNLTVNGIGETNNDDDNDRRKRGVAAPGEDPNVLKTRHIRPTRPHRGYRNDVDNQNGVSGFTIAQRICIRCRLNQLQGTVRSRIRVLNHLSCQRNTNCE